MLKRLLAPLAALLVAVGIVGGPAHATGSARLYLQPVSQKVAQGDDFTVEIWVDTGGATVFAVQANLNYRPHKLSCEAINTVEPFTVVAQNQCGDGYVYIARGAFQPGVTGKAIVATITFKAGPCTGDAPVNFAEGSGVATGEGEDILGSTEGAVYTIETGAPTGPCPKIKFPGSVKIQAGTKVAGGVSQLKADDDQYFSVQSTATTARWFGDFANVPNSLSSLRVNYKSETPSNAATISLEIYNYTSKVWAPLSTSRIGGGYFVGDAPTPLADYVSGPSGKGHVRVRVTAESSSGPFQLKNELLRILFAGN